MGHIQQDLGHNIHIWSVVSPIWRRFSNSALYTMTLDRLKGTWSCGGDVFFVIRLHSHGLLQELGPVCIGRRESPLTRRSRSKPVFTHPVSVEGRKAGGSRMELRFGQYWSLEDAHEVSAQLAEFLNRSVQDDSVKES